MKVAVIDSGIDADHPDVGGRVGGYVAVTWLSQTDPSGYSTISRYTAIPSDTARPAPASSAS